MPPSEKPTLAWYLLYTKPHQEFVALENLERQGYRAYLPRIRVRRRRAGHYRMKVEPLFPRYLFLYLDSENDDWGPIRSTIGVAGLVRFGMLPARVPDDLVDMLIGREDEDGIQNLPVKEFEPGQDVRIIEGVFKGYSGRLLAQSATERVTVLLQIVNKQVRLQLSLDDIDHADDRGGLG